MTPADIRQLRDRFGWTQQDLARYMGVSRATVVRWEMARGEPNARNPSGLALRFLRVLAALGSPVDAPD